MHRFEMHPHRVRGIGEPAVGKRIGGEQIAEFVVIFWLRDTPQECDRGATDKREQSDKNNRPSRAGTVNQFLEALTDYGPTGLKKNQ
jgi:hypothetical protein